MIVKVYEVRPDDAKGRHYEIDGKHKWGLPGIQCLSCGNTWVSVGLAYPSTDISRLPTSERYCKNGAASVEAMEELRRPLHVLMPNHPLLKPGTSFGPLIGKAYGQIGDFAFCGSWTLLIRTEALQALENVGVRGLIGVQPQLKWLRGTVPVRLVELEIKACTLVAPSSLQPEERRSCAACGYRRLKTPAPIILAHSSIPADLDLFRGRDFTTRILATGRFVETVQTLGLAGLVFHEVEIA